MSVKTLQRGAQRARHQKRREAIRRVRAYDAWLRAGSPLRSIPEIPSNHDFKVASGER